MLALLALVAGSIATNPDSGAEITTCAFSRVSDRGPAGSHLHIEFAARSTNPNVRYVDLMIGLWDKNGNLVRDGGAELDVAAKIAHAANDDANARFAARMRCGILMTKDAKNFEIWRRPVDFQPVLPTTAH